MKNLNRTWTRRDLMRAGLATTAATALPRWARGVDAAARAIRFTGSDSLRAHAQAHGLLYGAAVIPALLDVDALAAGNTPNAYTQLVSSQGNIVVAENAMKWGPLRPTPT
jgi:endo-1,4-beta-xylanase